MEKEIKNIELKLNLLIDYLEKQDEKNKDFQKDHLELEQMMNQFKKLTYQQNNELSSHVFILEHNKNIIASYHTKIEKLTSQTEGYLSKVPKEIESIRHIQFDPGSFRRAVYLFYIILFSIMGVIFGWMYI